MSNEWGIPLHACNGYRQDEHVWEWMKWVMDNCEPLGTDGIKVYYGRVRTS